MNRVRARTLGLILATSSVAVCEAGCNENRQEVHDAALEASDPPDLQSGGPDAARDARSEDADSDPQCGTATCGPSTATGRNCGECGPTLACSLGQCISASQCPNTCTDAFGGKVCEASAGYTSCPADAAKKLKCVCGKQNGTQDFWYGCDFACTAP